MRIMGARRTSELERRVHNCNRCKRTLRNVIKHCPVYSFGDPTGRGVIVVGLNPSDNEYESGHLSKARSLALRHRSQLKYIGGKEVYKFFHELERFFAGELKQQLQWEKSPWERVGFLDLVVPYHTYMESTNKSTTTIARREL
jgi:hypothetical protein